MANSISLDDLVALNDEIAGIVRSGVPLEMGLSGWGRDVGGPLGRLVAQLSEAVARGQSLPQSLAECRGQIPPVYNAIVTAGLKSGRLSAALESLASSARNLKEVRAAVGLAVLYPLVLILLGYCLTIALLRFVVPALLLPYDSNPPKFWSALAQFATLADAAIPIPGTDLAIEVIWLPPMVLVIAATFWWSRTRRAIMLDAGLAARWLCCVPRAGRVARNAKTATLAEVLGLLVEHDVPLGEAVVLAAECTADRALARSAQRLAASLAQGAEGERRRSEAEGFPPLLVWLVSSPIQKQTLVPMARHVAETHRRKTASDVQWLRDYLPIWLMLLVGGLVALLYCLTLFLPLTQLMEALSGGVSRSLRIR